MAFTGNVTCNTFKTGLLDGRFDFGADTLTTYYIALYTNAATLDANTTAYTTTGEVVAGGYTAGGAPLTITQTPTGDGTSYISFANVSWAGAFTARGALIYKPGDNGAVCVLDFGADKTSTTTFTVQFPAATSTSAIIRIA